MHVRSATSFPFAIRTIEMTNRFRFLPTARVARVLSCALCAIVLAGCALAVAIYWSLGRDDVMADKAGARRVAAAIGARTTSQPVLEGSARFSARRALQGLYGNYDPVLDGAYWTITGAPKPLAGWNGKTVVIKPLISRSDDTTSRHVLVTHSIEVKNGIAVKQGAGCRNCKSLLGSALFERLGAE
jgi:hypothetical protein